MDAMLKQVHLPASSHRCARGAFASVEPSGVPRSIVPPLPLPPPPLLPPLPPPPLLPLLSKLDGLLLPVAAQAAMGSPRARTAPIAGRGRERLARVFD
jgi:hypothetical protein